MVRGWGAGSWTTESSKLWEAALCPQGILHPHSSGAAALLWGHPSAVPAEKSLRQPWGSPGKCPAAVTASAPGEGLAPPAAGLWGSISCAQHLRAASALPDLPHRCCMRGAKCSTQISLRPKENKQHYRQFEGEDMNQKGVNQRVGH